MATYISISSLSYPHNLILFCSTDALVCCALAPLHRLGLEETRPVKMADTGLVVVVGAGIAGLAVALALNKVRNGANQCYCLHIHEPNTYMTEQGASLKPIEGVRRLRKEYESTYGVQVGIPVTVLEKADTLREEGASINLATNAWRAMEVLGIADTLRERFCRIERYSSADCPLYILCILRQQPSHDPAVRPGTSQCERPGRC